MNETQNKPKKRFIDTLKHAFAVEAAEEPFQPEDIALMEKLAQAVVKRQLATMAVMTLETVRPLNFLGSQAMVFFQPIISMVFSTEEYERFSRILERRQSIPMLIETIEKADDARIAKEKELRKNPGCAGTRDNKLNVRKNPCPDVCRDA
jgi:hypothetical protein